MVPWVGLQFVIVVFPDHSHFYLGRTATKPVFGVSDIRSSATETSYKSEFFLVESIDTILSKKQITRALIRLP